MEKLIELNKDETFAYIDYLKSTGNIERLSSLCQQFAAMVENCAEPKKNDNIRRSWLEKGVLNGSKWRNKKTLRVVEMEDHTSSKGGIKVKNIGNRSLTQEQQEKLLESTSFSGAENIGISANKNSYTPKDWECIAIGPIPIGCKTQYIAKIGDNLRTVFRKNGIPTA